MRTTLLAAALIAAVLPSVAARAQQAAKGDEIKAAISGNTVQGSMMETGAYAEFYDPSGAIRGKEYAGTWTIEGDAMCFTYEGSEKSCWQASIAGDQVQWLRDGKPAGDGTILQGNANGY